MMKKYSVFQNGDCLADKVGMASGFFTRLKGLMFRRKLETGEGLLLTDCGQIHCCFMRFPIDVVYLDREMKVLYVETVRPWRVGRLVKGSRNVLELEEGKAVSLNIDDCLMIKENTAA